MGDDQGRLLVRDRDVDAGEAARREVADRGLERAGLDRQALVGVGVVEAERGQRGRLHRGRAAVVDRPAEDGQAPQRHGPTPPSRSAVIRTTTPGGGLSIGGNFTSGPR